LAGVEPGVQPVAAHVRATVRVQDALGLAGEEGSQPNCATMHEEASKIIADLRASGQSDRMAAK
jgi:hypothetical protein